MRVDGWMDGWMDDGVTTRILVRGKYMKVGGWMDGLGDNKDFVNSK